MKMLVIVFALSLVGCGALRMDQEEYILKLADKCQSINITPQQTKLACHVHRLIPKTERN